MARAAKTAKTTAATSATDEREADAGASEAPAPALRLKDLVERVVARSGAKKKDAKPVIEATLAVIGEALARGEGLNLPALGRARVNRQKETEGGGTMVVRFRRTASRAVKLPPANAAAE